MKLFVLASAFLALLASVDASALPPTALPPTPPTLPASVYGCGGYATLLNASLSPRHPRVGTTAIINATFLSPLPVLGGVGAINAYMGGSDVFEYPVNTCGAGQQIDVEGLETAILDAPACPLIPFYPFALSFALPLPAAAAGLGELFIAIAGADTMLHLVYCVTLHLVL